MHVSDHSRVASLLFFYRVIRSSFMLLIAVEQRFCKFALFCVVHLICVLPGTSFAVMGYWSTHRERAGSCVPRPNEMANLDNGFAATRARMLENALND